MRDLFQKTFPNTETQKIEKKGGGKVDVKKSLRLRMNPYLFLGTPVGEKGKEGPDIRGTTSLRMGFFFKTR